MIIYLPIKVLLQSRENEQPEHFYLMKRSGFTSDMAQQRIRNLAVEFAINIPNSKQEGGTRVNCPKCQAVFMAYEDSHQKREDLVQCPRCSAVFIKETGLEEMKKKGV